MERAAVAWSAVAAALVFTCAALVMWIDAGLIFRGAPPISLVAQTLIAGFPLRAGIVGGVILFALGTLFGHLLGR